MVRLVLPFDVNNIPESTLVVLSDIFDVLTVHQPHLSRTVVMRELLLEGLESGFGCQPCNIRPANTTTLTSKLDLIIDAD